MVEMVVVGELSDDVVELESRESWWLWKDEKAGPCNVFPLEVRCATWLPCAVLGSLPDVCVCPMLCGSPPKTAPNEGMGMYFLDVVVGMLGGGGNGAPRGGRARVVLGQRLSCANLCSDFLEGKEGLGVGEDLLRTGVSVWCTRIEAEAEAEAGEAGRPPRRDMAQGSRARRERRGTGGERQATHQVGSLGECARMPAPRSA